MTAGAAAASTNASIAINIINFLNSYPLLTKGFPSRLVFSYLQPGFRLQPRRIPEEIRLLVASA
jgi:hypothetical protein